MKKPCGNCDTVYMKLQYVIKLHRAIHIQTKELWGLYQYQSSGSDILIL